MSLVFSLGETMIHTHLFSLIFFGTLSLIGGFDPDEEFHRQNGGLKEDFEAKPVDGANCRLVEEGKPESGSSLMLGWFAPEKELNLGHPFPVPPDDGANCKWHERRISKLIRELRIYCKNPTYSCTYKGNPHSCNWYNHHQMQFYDGLAKVAATKQPTACSLKTLVNDECPYVEFIKEE